MATSAVGIRSDIRRVGIQEFLRLAMPLWVVLYCAAFNWSYATWISRAWGYIGLVNKSPSVALMIVGYILAAALCLVSPLRITRPTQVIYWCLYFTVYVPALFVPLFVQFDKEFTLLLIQLSMTIGMLLIALSYRLKILRFQRYPIKPVLFWILFSVIFILANAVLLVFYRHNLQFASLDEIYKVRLAAKKITEENAGIGYISAALSNVLNPLLIAYGLSTRKRSLTALGILGQVVVYMTAAMKSVLTSPFLIIVFFYSLKKDRGGWVPWMGLLLAGLFFFLTTLVTATGQGLIFNISTVALVRTFALPGLFVGQYQYFFENFPHTYLGHVTGINLLIPSPYQLPTGLEITSFYKGGGGGSDMTNANANFFAMDGIVGFGLIGIPFMGIVCAALFWLIDSCSRRYTIPLCASAITMCAISLTNSSLFTTFLGGGVLMWLLLFILMPKKMANE
jgi:hypothetical protein